jgi:hypothetical protein
MDLEQLRPPGIFDLKVLHNVYYLFRFDFKNNSISFINNVYKNYNDLFEFALYHVSNDTLYSDDYKNQVIKRINFQKERVLLFYLKKKLKAEWNFGTFFRYLGNLIIYRTVRFGYKGEGNFVITLLVVSLFFTVLFYFRFYTHIKEKFILPDNENQEVVKRNIFIRLFQCLHFSFVVLINPKFPLEYFKFNNRLLAWVIFLWAIGIVLMALFLVYIASQYSFIRDLIG